jgi:hypothetical protein
MKARMSHTGTNPEESMHRSSLRQFLGYALILVFPYSLFAADASGALLYSSGATLLNGAGTPHSSAIFKGDEIRTSENSVANIATEGSSVLVRANSSVRFEGNAVQVTEGGVVVSTSKGMSARAGDLNIAPASEKASKFEVAESDGEVLIAAREGGVIINDGTGTTVLQEGQQTTRDDVSQSDQASNDQNANQNTRKRRRRRGGAVAAGSGAPISGKTAAYAAGAAGGAIALAAILTTGSPKCSISPSKPGEAACK